MTFNLGDVRACEQIRTRSDVVYEDDEVITLTLISTNSNIAIIGSSTQIEIEDNDSKVLSRGLCINHVACIFQKMLLLSGQKCYTVIAKETISLCVLYTRNRQKGALP